VKAFSRHVGPAIVALAAAACGGVQGVGGVAHWEYADDDHRMYVTTDPRDADEDRHERVPIGVRVDDVRVYTQKFINGIRAMNGRRRLGLDAQLTEFAQQGSIELSRNHLPHHHFETESWRSSSGALSEVQGSHHGWAPGPADTQVAEIVRGMMEEGPGGGHHDAILDPQWRRMGVGIVNPGGLLYFTVDFGR
jgi:uncharacterized protein YkwD